MVLDFVQIEVLGSLFVDGENLGLHGPGNHRENVYIGNFRRRTEMKEGSMKIPGHLLRPKVPTKHHIFRQRLLERFNRTAFVKTLLLYAPAGYGKTRAVIDIIQQATSPVAWYPLEFLVHPTAVDFLSNFVWAVQQVVPSFGKDLNLLFQEQPAPDINNVLLPAIVNEFGGLSQSLLIVLENFHRVYAQEINDSLIYLIERSSSNVQFIITSRSVPKWPVQWTTDDQLTTLTKEELAFTYEECIDLAVNVGIQLTQNEVNEIFDRIGGWPILHALLYTNLRDAKNRQLMDFLHSLSMPNSMIYEYLAGEILNKEAPWIQDILRKTSVLQQIDGEICEALLDIPNGDIILDQLATSVFLTPLNAEKKQYYIHSHEIMQTFLLQELHRVHGQLEVERLYKRVGEIMEAQNALDQAVTYFCHGQHFGEAGRIIKEHGPRLVSSIDLPRLQRWLEQIPRSQLDQDPSLLVYLGIVLTNTERALADIPLYQARDIFKGLNDTVKRVWAEGELTWLLFLQGKLKEGLSYIGPALQEPHLPAEIKARLLHVMTMMLYGKDDLKQSLLYAEQAVQLYRSLRTVESRMSLSRLLRHLSSVYCMQGRFRDALQVLEEAYQLATALKQGNLSLAWINHQMAPVYQHLARFDEAHRCIDQAEHLLDGYPVQPNLPKFIVTNRGHIYRETYNYELAEECYRKSREGKPNGVFMALRLVQLGRAQEALILALPGWQKSRNVESPVDQAKWDAVLGIAHLSAGNSEQARHHLEQAEAVLQKYEAWFHVATTRLYLAKLYLQLGKMARAHICLNYTLSEMKHNGYYSLDVWQSWVVAELCAYAIEQDIEAIFAEELAIKRLDKTSAEPFLRLLSHLDSRVRSQSTRILEHMGDTIRLYAYQLLDNCEELAIKRRLREYLQKNWLAEAGLIRLVPFFTWREADIFLLWISPHIRGSSEKMAEIAFITPGTVKDHLKKIRLKLESIISKDLSGKGAYMVGSDWAISEYIIDPHNSFALDSHE